jgi:predicted PhzF superfamily epimerase YddE/YHI9
MAVEVFLVDAFVGEGCLGNLAGVVRAERELSDLQMQSIAAHVGASETAFIIGNRIRWFTPTIEVGLCGHATLAAAHWLWENGFSADLIEFESRGGRLSCRRVGGLIEMEFPELPCVACKPEAGLLEALGVQSAVVIAQSGKYFLVEVASQSMVAALSPDFKALSQLSCDGVYVTSVSESYDFVSRCFFPKEGIPEDPVTGSAHCTLGPYWRGRLSREKLFARQLSREGGEIHISFKPSRVVLGGVARVRAGSKLIN